MAESYTFQALFLEQLNDIYTAEEQVIPLLPRLLDITSATSLREEFGRYAKLLDKHLQNLQQSFASLHTTSIGSPCTSIPGILQEIEQVMHHGGNSAVKDAALIALMQRIQHLKMAMYGTCRTYARHLNEDDIMDFCQQALHEEIEADKKLTLLAEGGVFTTGINQEAVENI
jgi:ferritin-like metal-binding protein YciE